MTKKKKVYTAEFKENALKLMEIHGIEKTAADLGVSQASLRNWSRKNNKSVSSTSLTDKELQKENKRLQKEIQYLKKINEVLKKSTAIFSQAELPPFKK
jgi:transposase-like protein